MGVGGIVKIQVESVSESVSGVRSENEHFYRLKYFFLKSISNKFLGAAGPRTMKTTGLDSSRDIKTACHPWLDPRSNKQANNHPAAKDLLGTHREAKRWIR